jgi:hypothetical protein
MIRTSREGPTDRLALRCRANARFNVVDPQTADQTPGLMANLCASLPTRQDLQQGTAETLD